MWSEVAIALAGGPIFNDQLLSENVENEWKPRVEASHIGYVHSFHERRAAEDAGFAAPGVSAVDNEITIGP